MPNPLNIYLDDANPISNNQQETTFNVVTNGSAPTAAITYTDGSGWATASTPVLLTSSIDSNEYQVVVTVDVNDYSVSGDNPRRATLTMTHSDGTTTDTNFIDQYGYDPTADTLTINVSSAVIGAQGGTGTIEITSSLATGDLPGMQVLNNNENVISVSDVTEVSGQSYTHKVDYSFGGATNVGGNLILNFFHQYNRLADAVVNASFTANQSPVESFSFNPSVASGETITLSAGSHSVYEIPIFDNNESTTEYKVKDPTPASYGAWDEDFLNSPTGSDSTWFNTVSVVDISGFNKVLQFNVDANATGSTRYIDLGGRFNYIAPETIINGSFLTTGTLTSDSVDLGVKTYGINNSSLASGALTVKGPYGVEFTDGFSFNLNSLSNTDYRLTYTITANAGSAGLQYYVGASNGYKTIPSTVGTHNIYFKNLSDGYRLIFRNVDSTGANAIVFSSVSLRETPMDSIRIEQLSS